MAGKPSEMVFKLFWCLLARMICLGIESTAHTFGVGIVDGKGRVLANERQTFTTESGGIRPYKAFEHHVLLAEFVLQNAIQKSGINSQNIEHKMLKTNFVSFSFLL